MMNQENDLMKTKENEAKETLSRKTEFEDQILNSPIADGEVKIENFSDSDIERLLESPIDNNMLSIDPLSTANDANGEVTTEHVNLIITELKTMNAILNGSQIKEETASYTTTEETLIDVVNTDETNTLAEIPEPLPVEEPKSKTRSRKKITEQATCSRYLNDADAVKNIVKIAKEMKQQQKKARSCKIDSENPEEIGPNKKKCVSTCSKNILKTLPPTNHRIAGSYHQPSTSKLTDFQQSMDTSVPNTGENCSRCLWSFNKGETIWIPPCGQLFHNRCVYLWAKKLEECPVCHIIVKKKEMTNRKNRVQRKS